MTEFEKLFKAMDAERLMKAVADGFKGMSQAIDSLAGHIEALSKTEVVTRKRAKAAAKKVPKKKAKAAAPKAAAKKAKTTPKKVMAKKKAKAAAPKAAAKKAKSAAPKKKAKKSTAAKKSGKTTAIDTIYGYISRARNGINVESLIKKTGYDNKKVHNVLYKLKNQKKVKSVKRGIYEKV